jgi:hypothetical protein
MRNVLCAAALLAAVPALAGDKSAVRALDVKNVKLAPPKIGEIRDRVTVIGTADELAKSPAFADDASREAVKKQVDFSKEKVVVVTWWGSTTSWVEPRLSKDGKSVWFPVVTGSPALADLRPHVAAFAVPADVTVLTDPDLVKLSLKGVAVDFSQGGSEPKPLEVKSADELAKADVFADEAGRDAIKKQVDFSKDKLVVFVWSGSGQDKLGAALSKDGRTAVFTYTVGLTDDLRRHAYVFAVPKDCDVKLMK